MRCVAVIMVRNGVEYVENCIKHLISNNIEVAVIDQESDDGTYELCEKFLKDGEICSLKRVSFPGFFSLEFQLEQKYLMMESLQADWVIHQDIDECLIGSNPANQNLYDSILSEHEKGFSVINFHELVFIPFEEYSSCFDSPFYYYFGPFAPRLMRAWKKSEGLSALGSGGHVLKATDSTELNISPSNFYLKHYIFTSQQHAYAKYESRKFSDKDVNDLGWHENRINIQKSKLTFPEKTKLQKLDNIVTPTIDISVPWLKHYWDI